MHYAPAQNVLARRNGPRPDTRRQDLLNRDRDETFKGLFPLRCALRCVALRGER